MKPAVFLDRDGTIIEQVHHLRSPADVRLIAGAARGLRLLCDARYARVVVTNQSVIGRGLLSPGGLREIHEEIVRQLEVLDASVDAFYHCPVVPIGSDPLAIEHPDRKPGPGMLLRAAREHSLDLRRSWMVGDALSDTLAGRNAGCRGGVLVRTGYGSTLPTDLNRLVPTDHVADDLEQAARWILAQGSDA